MVRRSGASQQAQSCAHLLSLELELCLQMPIHWKQLNGKNPESKNFKNFRKLLRRGTLLRRFRRYPENTLKPSKSDIFYLLRNFVTYLPRTFFFRKGFFGKATCRQKGCSSSKRPQKLEPRSVRQNEVFENL